MQLPPCRARERLEHLAIETVVQWYEPRLEREVLGLQREWNCSLNLALAFAQGIEFLGPKLLDLEFFAACLMSEWNNAALLVEEQASDPSELFKTLLKSDQHSHETSAEECFRAAGELARVLGHSSWGTDHLLLHLLSGEVETPRELRVNLNTERVMRTIDILEREPQDLDWSAKGETYERWLRFQGKSRDCSRSPYRNYVTAGEALCEGLDRFILARTDVNLSNLLASDLFKAIKIPGPFDLRGTSSRYLWQYRDLADAVEELLAERDLDPPVLRKLLDEVADAWKLLPITGCRFTRYVREALYCEKLSSLELAQRLTSQKPSPFAQFLSSIGLNTEKLSQALRACHSQADPETVFCLLRGAEAIARSLTGEENPLISSLHILLAMVEHQEPLDVRALFRKLGVLPSDVRQFARSAKVER